MSLSPADTPQRPPEAANLSVDPGRASSLSPVRKSRVLAICFAVLAFEIGGFLVVFPWMDAWRLNHFPSFYPPLFEIWDDPYFRGAVSGLGVVDVLIAIWQTALLLKKSKNS